MPAGMDNATEWNDGTSILGERLLRVWLNLTIDFPIGGWGLYKPHTAGSSQRTQRK